MNQTVDLGTVLGNTFSTLSWTGFTLTCALVLIGALWQTRASEGSRSKQGTDACDAIMRGHLLSQILG